MSFNELDAQASIHSYSENVNKNLVRLQKVEERGQNWPEEDEKHYDELAEFAKKENFK